MTVYETFTLMFQAGIFLMGLLLYIRENTKK